MTKIFLQHKLYSNIKREINESTSSNALIVLVDVFLKDEEMVMELSSIIEKKGYFLSIVISNAFSKEAIQLSKYLWTLKQTNILQKAVIGCWVVYFDHSSVQVELDRNEKMIYKEHTNTLDMFILVSPIYSDDEKSQENFKLLKKTEWQEHTKGIPLSVLFSILNINKQNTELYIVALRGLFLTEQSCITLCEFLQEIPNLTHFSITSLTCDINSNERIITQQLLNICHIWASTLTHIVISGYITVHVGLSNSIATIISKFPMISDIDIAPISPRTTLSLTYDAMDKWRSGSRVVMVLFLKDFIKKELNYLDNCILENKIEQTDICQLNNNGGMCESYLEIFNKEKHTRNRWLSLLAYFSPPVDKNHNSKYVYKKKEVWILFDEWGKCLSMNQNRGFCALLMAVTSFLTDKETNLSSPFSKRLLKSSLFSLLMLGQDSEMVARTCFIYWICFQRYRMMLIFQYLIPEILQLIKNKYDDDLSNLISFFLDDMKDNDISRFHYPSSDEKWTIRMVNLLETWKDIPLYNSLSTDIQSECRFPIKKKQRIIIKDERLDITSAEKKFKQQKLLILSKHESWFRSLDANNFLEDATWQRIYALQNMEQMDPCGFHIFFIKNTEKQIQYMIDALSSQSTDELIFSPPFLWWITQRQKMPLNIQVSLLFSSMFLRHLIRFLKAEVEEHRFPMIHALINLVEPLFQSRFLLFGDLINQIQVHNCYNLLQEFLPYMKEKKEFEFILRTLSNSISYEFEMKERHLNMPLFNIDMGNDHSDIMFAQLQCIEQHDEILSDFLWGCNRPKQNIKWRNLLQTIFVKHSKYTKIVLFGEDHKEKNTQAIDNVTKFVHELLRRVISSYMSPIPDMIFELAIEYIETLHESSVEFYVTQSRFLSIAFSNQVSSQRVIPYTLGKLLYMQEIVNFMDIKKQQEAEDDRDKNGYLNYYFDHYDYYDDDEDDDEEEDDRPNYNLCNMHLMQVKAIQFLPFLIQSNEYIWCIIGPSRQKSWEILTPINYPFPNISDSFISLIMKLSGFFTMDMFSCFSARNHLLVLSSTAQPRFSDVLLKGLPEEYVDYEYVNSDPETRLYALERFINIPRHYDSFITVLMRCCASCSPKIHDIIATKYANEMMKCIPLREQNARLRRKFSRERGQFYAIFYYRFAKNLQHLPIDPIYHEIQESLFELKNRRYSINYPIQSAILSTAPLFIRCLHILSKKVDLANILAPIAKKAAMTFIVENEFYTRRNINRTVIWLLILKGYSVEIEENKTQWPELLLTTDKLIPALFRTLRQCNENDDIIITACIACILQLSRSTWFQDSLATKDVFYACEETNLWQWDVQNGGGYGYIVEIMNRTKSNMVFFMGLQLFMVTVRDHKHKDYSTSVQMLRDAGVVSCLVNRLKTMNWQSIHENPVAFDFEGLSPFGFNLAQKKYVYACKSDNLKPYSRTFDSIERSGCLSFHGYVAGFMLRLTCYLLCKIDMKYNHAHTEKGWLDNATRILVENEYKIPIIDDIKQETQRLSVLYVNYLFMIGVRMGKSRTAKGLKFFFQNELTEFSKIAEQKVSQNDFDKLRLIIPFFNLDFVFDDKLLPQEKCTVLSCKYGNIKMLQYLMSCQKTVLIRQLTSNITLYAHNNQTEIMIWLRSLNIDLVNLIGGFLLGSCKNRDLIRYCVTRADPKKLLSNLSRHICPSIIKQLFYSGVSIPSEIIYLSLPKHERVSGKAYCSELMDRAYRRILNKQTINDIICPSFEREESVLSVWLTHGGIDTVSTNEGNKYYTRLKECKKSFYENLIFVGLTDVTFTHPRMSSWNRMLVNMRRENKDEMFFSYLGDRKKNDIDYDKHSTSFRHWVAANLEQLPDEIGNLVGQYV